MRTELSTAFPRLIDAQPPLAAPAALDARGRARQALTTSPLPEVLAVAGLLAALFGVFIWRLGAVLVPYVDEGTYLYAAKLVTDGQVPYRDFLLAHPPLLIYLAAAWMHVAGTDVTAARLANLSLVLASTVPLYLVVRQMTRSCLSGLLAVAAYPAGLLLVGNMGRTVMLDPVVNAFLLLAFALYAMRKGSAWLRLGFGVLAAAAVLTKFVAVIPIGLIVLGDLAFSRPERRFWRSWLTGAAGAALILVPAGITLMRTPGFLDDTLISQVERGGMPLILRVQFLYADVLHFPVILLAMLASAWYLARGKDWRVRVAALAGLGTVLALVIGFKSFFAYYVVLGLPWLTIAFAVACHDVVRRASVRVWRPALAALTLTVGLIVPAAYEEAYYRAGASHGSSPAQIVPILAQTDGYIYSIAPLYALWSGRPEYPWYYSADALMPRLVGRLTSEDLEQAFSGSQAVVLWADELHDYPQADAYLRSHFELRYQDEYYSLWLRHTT
jgi:4-amino-4-deoxy-L-arabinose transferase-like glycosyltransferase